MLSDITSKVIINRLHEDRYNDIILRGKYYIVYCNNYFINFLINTDIKYEPGTYNYIKPIGVNFINRIVNIFKNIYYGNSI